MYQVPNSPITRKNKEKNCLQVLQNLCNVKIIANNNDFLNILPYTEEIILIDNDEHSKSINKNFGDCRYYENHLRLETSHTEEKF